MNEKSESSGNAGHFDGAPSGNQRASGGEQRGSGGQKRSGPKHSGGQQSRGGPPKGQGGGQGGGQGRSRGGKGRSRRRRGRGRRPQQGGHDPGGTLQNEPLDGPKDTYLGLLERLGNGAGFIRREHSGYTPSDEDIYVSPKIVGRYDLRTGDEICGQAGNPPRPGKSPPLRYLHTVNSVPPADLGERPRSNAPGSRSR